MEKSWFEKVFGSWLIVILAIVLIVYAISTKMGGEAYPESPSQSQSTNSQND